MIHLLLLLLLCALGCSAQYLGVVFYNTPLSEMNLCNKSEYLLAVYVMEENSGCINRDFFNKISNEVTALNGSAGDLEVSIWTRCNQVMVNRTVMTEEERVSGKCTMIYVNQFAFLYYGETIQDVLSYTGLTYEPLNSVYVNRKARNCTAYEAPVAMLYFPGLKNHTQPDMCYPMSDVESVLYTDFGSVVDGPGLQLQSSSGSLSARVFMMLILLMFVVLK